MECDISVSNFISMKSCIIQFAKRLRDGYLRLRRSRYFDSISGYFGNGTSIICSNCLGGRILQDIGMQYNTPTLGLFFPYPDYIEFCRDLKYYLTEAKLSFVDESRYPERNEHRAKWPFRYPIGMLDGKIEIHFLHYHSREEAETKWLRRSIRINWDRLFVIGMDQNGCTVNDIEAFDKLPIKNKIFFSSRPVDGESIVFMREFGKNGCVGDPYKKGHVFYKYLAAYFGKRKN